MKSIDGRGEGTVREWIRRTLAEHGLSHLFGSKTVPKAESPPVEPKRASDDEADDPPLLRLAAYRGKDEKRVPPRSIKSTRDEKGTSPEDLQRISQGLRAETVDIGGMTWSQDDLYIPAHRGLGISGVRKELETASDKLQIARAAPELVIQMLERALKDYKQLLREPHRAVVACLREYTRDLEGTGELTRNDIMELRSFRGQAALATGLGFKEFMHDWVCSEAHSNVKRVYQQEPLRFGSIVTVARTGTLDFNDRTLSRRSLAEDLFMETTYRPSVTVVDRALALRDPGFRYYVGGLGGKYVAYWDWVRNSMPVTGHKAYMGQL